MSQNPLPQNDQLILICGESGAGKSASLMNIPDQEDWVLLRAEPKRLPFKNKFKEYIITDPYQVTEGFEFYINNPDKLKGMILESITFTMNLFESKYVIGSSGFSAWTDFQQYFKDIMTDKIPRLNKPVIITAHTRSELDEATARYRTSVPIKGALKNEGVEAYFSCVMAAKKVELDELEKYQNALLNITADDEARGYKHVFQTRITKATVGERIRSPIGLFSDKETYIDNDTNLVLQRLNEYYS